jgi:hypothetical protein
VMTGRGSTVGGWWLLAVFNLLLSIVITTNAQTFSIDVTSANNAFGGQPFLQQPKVQIFDAVGLLADTFVGNAIITMGSSPSGFELLYKGTCDIQGFCGTVVSGTVGSVPFIKGIATFQVRYIFIVFNSLFAYEFFICSATFFLSVLFD